MNKISYIFISIITLGIYPIYIHSKAKKQTSPNSKIATSHTSGINVNDFITTLGGMDNISSTDATISSLVITLNIPIGFSNEDQNRFGIRGLLINDKKYTFIFGDNANAIRMEINALLNHN